MSNFSVLFRNPFIQIRLVLPQHFDLRRQVQMMLIHLCLYLPEFTLYFLREILLLSALEPVHVAYLKQILRIALPPMV